MIPDSETPECPEFDVRSTIRKIFDIEDILEEYSVRIYKIDPYFYEHYNKKKKKKKIQVDENGCEYILFRIDYYFTKYLLTVEIDEIGHTDRDLIFEKKRQEALEKQLGQKFIRINTSKKGYNTDYISKIQRFINDFKDRQLEKEKLEKEKLKKESNKKIKELENKIKEEQKSKLAKELLSYVSSISMSSVKPIKYFAKKILPTL